MKDEIPSVSIVLTTYKRPSKLKKSLATATNQTYKDIEIIVVDGGNCNETKKVAESFDNVRYFRVEPEYVDASFWKGVQHARNIGCKEAKGEYIALLDDDDIWEPTKLEQQINAFENVSNFGDKKLGAVICYNKMIGTNYESVDKPQLIPTYEDLLKGYQLSATSAFLIRRDVLEEIGWWDEELRGMHEWDISLKLLKKGYWIYTIPEVLVTKNWSRAKSNRYYYIKVGEVMDFLRFYEKDLVSYLGIKKAVVVTFKTIGLLALFFSGYIIRDRVWDITQLFKTVYEKKQVIY